MGQLDDAGNTTTIAHYLNVLSDAGLLTGIQKYSDKTVRKRASSPPTASTMQRPVEDTISSETPWNFLHCHNSDDELPWCSQRGRGYFRICGGRI